MTVVAQIRFDIRCASLLSGCTVHQKTLCAQATSNKDCLACKLLMKDVVLRLLVLLLSKRLGKNDCSQLYRAVGGLFAPAEVSAHCDMASVQAFSASGENTLPFAASVYETSSWVQSTLSALNKKKALAAEQIDVSQLGCPSSKPYIRG